jgi:hypothetical protein
MLLSFSWLGIYDCGFKLIEHLPYSPDLDPLDFLLILNLKTAISRTQFQSDDDVMQRGKKGGGGLNGQDKIQNLT